MVAVLSGAGPAWASGGWSVVPSPNVGTGANGLNGVTAISAGDVWAVGDYSTSSGTNTLIEHYNGTRWSVVPSPNGGTSDNVLAGVTAIAASDAWAVGYYSSTGAQQTLVEHHG